jgi:hypothetical protein
MIRPDLIIFDCDGVLVDSEVLSCRCLSDTLAGYGIDLGVDQALDLFLGRSVTAVFQHYEALGRSIPEQFAAELRAGVRAAFLSVALPDRRGEARSWRTCKSRIASPRPAMSIGCPSRFPDRPRAAFRHAALYLANGGTRQAGARPLPLRGRKDAGGSASHPRDRGQRQRRKAGKAAGMTVWGFVGGSHYQSRDGKAILREAGADRVFGRMADFWRRIGKD